MGSQPTPEQNARRKHTQKGSASNYIDQQKESIEIQWFSSDISRRMSSINWQFHQAPVGPPVRRCVIPVLSEVDATNKGHVAIEDDGFHVR